MISEQRRGVIILTLVIHANAAGVEADVVLVFVSLVLHHVEERCVFHLQPEFTVLVFQRRFILFLDNTISVMLLRGGRGGCGQRQKKKGCAFTVA